MTALSRRSALAASGAVGAALLVPATARAATASGTASADSSSAPSGAITVASGETVTISSTTRVSAVTIASGGTLTAPSGYSLTMTVNGVETGQALTATGGADTAFTAGSWRGDIVLTVSKAVDITWQSLTYPFRQAIYVAGGAVVEAESVFAAVVGGRLSSTSADNVKISSTGECFDGVYVADSAFTLTRPHISLNGNGRCDFVGYGAAVVVDGTSGNLVLDGAVIDNQGAQRTGVIVDDGATALIKNSSIRVRNGVLPSDYVATVDLNKMESAPWMLAIDGNVRATNLLGNNSTAAYVNSSITSETWGVLSTDSGSDCTLVSVNSVVTNSGADGYGTYAIGSATEYLLGSEFNVGTYATIFTGGTATYGDSDSATVAALNESLGLGLTAADLKSLKPRNTVINSRRFGFMWHGWGTLTINGGTRVDTAHATFLNKGQQTDVTFDGSDGAQLNPADGIIVQLIDNDDPGPVMVSGVLENAGVYTQPTGEPAKDASFSVTTAHSTDSVFNFTGANLKGDFLNGMRGDLNMVLNFSASKVQGVISATLAEHAVTTIDSSNWWELGNVSNTPQAAVNNGAIVSLASGSQWAVTGTSYITSLTIDATSSVTAKGLGKSVTMTVDGVETAIKAGNTYTGAIVLTVG
ncbi:hypothetical protein KDK95_26460 [Actinospica sp. MGRD01-02]|uniref:Right handed beta helix domain-containing protein n=1 Tax=Actinospica acidithermotolerans TaxID=2828514 RepID=A0A941EE79_9ACTN|nr:hypothetical protein [Actinospica acidithermotolerans]MBR7829876.1 hypothetical protein [Actinospica acidithermotolerans]